MKSFATLCLLAIATAVRIQKPGQDGEERDGGCKRPRPCREELGEGIEELGEGIVEKTRELAKDMGADSDDANDRADRAASDLEGWVRDGKTCKEIRDKIEEQAKEDGVPEEKREKALQELDDAAEQVKERKERKEKEAALAQKKGKKGGKAPKEEDDGLAQKKGGKRPGPNGEESAEGSDTERELGDAKAELEEALDVEIDLDDVVEACKKLLSEDDDEEGDDGARELKAAQLDKDVVEEVVEKVEEELGEEGAKKLKAKAKAACRKGKRAIEKKEAEGDDDGQGPADGERKEKPQGEADEDGQGPDAGQKRGGKKE